MAQIRPITSEALEAKVRQLLPSQRGFGEDLQAQNVIVPIIDLTPAAEGSDIPLILQNAVNFTDSTSFNVSGAVTTIANTPGFWQITFSTTLLANVSGGQINVQINNGLSTKILWGQGVFSTGDTQISVDKTLVVFLEQGEDLQIGSSTASTVAIGSVRQIADVYGNLKNPTGLQVQ